MNWASVGWRSAMTQFAAFAVLNGCAAVTRARAPTNTAKRRNRSRTTIPYLPSRGREHAQMLALRPAGRPFLTSPNLATGRNYTPGLCLSDVPTYAPIGPLACIVCITRRPGDDGF